MAEVCAVKDCGKPAEWLPVVELRAPKVFGSDVPAPAVIRLPLCAGCRATTKLEDVFGDETFRMLSDTLAATGKARPDRARTTLTFTPIDGKMARQLDQAVAETRGRMN